MARAAPGRATLAAMVVEVTCRCGWTTRGSKSEVIAAIQAHGRSEHGLEVTPDEVRALWRVVKDDSAGARRSGGRR
jgi:predicted small metal-binding protein